MAGFYYHSKYVCMQKMPGMPENRRQIDILQKIAILLLLLSREGFIMKKCNKGMGKDKEMKDSKKMMKPKKK